MLRFVFGSMRRKLILIVLVATFAALLAASLALFLYDQRAYEASARADLITQADILARVSAVTLNFDDPKAARENLAALEARPQILCAALYEADGSLFARYLRPGAREAAFATVPTTREYHVEGSEEILFQPIIHNGERIGTVYLQARYEIENRLRDYLGILAGAMLISMLVAFAVSLKLQSAITQPILAVTRVARGVLEKRDYSQRVEKTTHDEVGVLVDAFNDMLHEVGQRSAALEASNRTLEHEMSERRLAEQALRSADRRKDEFLATLAHELRNPLAPIRNALHIMELAKGDPALTEKARATMDRQLTQMVRLVDDLLDVSRISRDALQLKRERVDLASILWSAIETCRPLIEQSGQELTVSLTPDPVIVDADPTRLAQVFSNLLNNASKYTPRGGHIQLAAQRSGDEVTIAVRDDGIGIPPEMLSKVFEMFSQLDRSLEKTQGGLGMGLTIVRRLVEMHGGTVEGRSEGEGRGTQFVVRLPVASAATAPEAPAGPGVAFAPAPGRRILVVDDHEDSALSMAMMLELMGNTTQVAHDGLQALDVAAKFLPEVVLLDIGMPKLNGYATARRIREEAWGKSIFLIALTGWGQDVDKARSAEAGFDFHLVKPVASEALAQLLASRPRTGGPG